MGKYINLESALCKELEKLDEKYRNGAEMSEGDLRKTDLLAHALKSLFSYYEKRDNYDAQRVAYENNGYYSPNTRYMENNMNGQYQGYTPNNRRW